MADKWADLLISKVEYSAEPRHIVRVALRLDRGTKVGPPVKVSRAEVMKWISAGYSVFTIYRADDGWQRGAEVQIVTIGGTRYISTEADRIAADNLGNLPEF
ncbi:MAG: DUF3892 domain-containing protein [Acidimicrobiales bacterium]